MNRALYFLIFFAPTPPQNSNYGFLTVYKQIECTVLRSQLMTVDKHRDHDRRNFANHKNFINISANILTR